MSNAVNESSKVVTEKYAEARLNGKESISLCQVTRKIKKTTKNGKTKQETVKIKNDFIEDIKLQEISAERLSQIRSNGKPGFVFKEEGKYYYAKITVETIITDNTLVKHQCSCENVQCENLMALPEEEGGCSKVLNRSREIEKFDFISCGYETFNTKRDSMIVIACNNCKKCSSQKVQTHMSLPELWQKLDEIAMYLHDLESATYNKF